MDFPPSYTQVFELRNTHRGDFDGLVPSDDDSPSAPFVPGSTGPSSRLDSVPMFHGLPDSVKFTSVTPLNNARPESYAFDLRDAMDCLVARGTVRNKSGAVTVQNESGVEFLYVNPTGSPSGGSRNLRSFDIRDRRRKLGFVELLSKTSLRLVPNEGSAFSVHSISPGDISIGRNLNSPPMCKIHMHPANYESSFEGSLVLPANSNTTQIEQCLCMAVAIAFAVVQNKEYEIEARVAAQRAVVEAQEAEVRAANGQIYGCIGACLVLFLICFGLWGIIKLLATATCSSRFSSNPGVKSKGCTASGYPDWI